MKYTEISKLLKKGKLQNIQGGADVITHYLQTHEPIWRQGAEEACDEIGIDRSILDVTVDFDVPFPSPNKTQFTFVDLFAGIGGFRQAFQSEGGKCVFSSEWNKYAQKTYEANYGEVPFGDITNVLAEDIPDHDVLVAGFPCQPFSIAGVSKKNALGRSHGFLDETQGTLFFDIARILKEKQPKIVLLENVKNLASHDKGRTFTVIQKTLKSLGYAVYAKVIDAKGWVPQHSERVFITAFLEKAFDPIPAMTFPESPDASSVCVFDILDSKVDKKYTLTNNLWKYLREYAAKHAAKGNGFGYGMVDLGGVSRTLSARYYKDGSEILIPQTRKNPRRLTPSECRRLMGYPDDFKIDGIGVSDTQLYKQFGNSVVVPVVTAVAENLVEHLKEQNKKVKKGRGRVKEPAV